MVPLINSLLDNDLYKFSMQMAVVKKFPRAIVKYSFINRGNTKFPKEMKKFLKEQLLYMIGLKLTKDEKLWLTKTCPFFEPAYLDFLEGYRYDSNEVKIDLTNEGELKIGIEGFWYRIILWEVPIMALISEIYFYLLKEPILSYDHREVINANKANSFIQYGVKYADFGTRRRYSFQIQNEVVEQFVNKGEKFVGTSNVHLAKTHNIKPMGTHAHEWFSFHGSKYGFKMANKIAMEHFQSQRIKVALINLNNYEFR